MSEKVKLIEKDSFPFEFLSQLGERESWRKEIHRPIYHLHKWWAKRLGTVFRGILLGSALGSSADLLKAFYECHDFGSLTVFDPFMGSGTTVGEAHKLGFAAFGRDINPVAVKAVAAAFGPMDRNHIEAAFRELEEQVGAELRSFYMSKDSRNRDCDVLYYFWVMQTPCPACEKVVDLFPSWVISRNAYPSRKPEVQILCPECGEIFQGIHREKRVTCGCGYRFDPEAGTALRAKATCRSCTKEFKIIEALAGRRPNFRLYGKLVLTPDNTKQYLAATNDDLSLYQKCSSRLPEVEGELPKLGLSEGYNTKQAMNYGFLRWRDFFNDRQLLSIAVLRQAIRKIKQADARNALGTLLSGVLEFNNMFASYKGEGTGAVRHMFSHHILKPERTPIEANVWGTAKSSGSFLNLYRSRLLRAIDYRNAPAEVNGTASAKGRVCSPAFLGELCPWGENVPSRGISLSCGDSATTGLRSESIDLVVTDPPFFDNVHYSELADFFYAWMQNKKAQSTRSLDEVQDSDNQKFSGKLRKVFEECHRLLKNDGLLVFTYHHSREAGWSAAAHAILGAGFQVVNSHPVKSEMSVAAPKSQAKEPIQLDIIVVCRKADESRRPKSQKLAIVSARDKIKRLENAGFQLSKNDWKIILYGQLLTALKSASDIDGIGDRVDKQLKILADEARTLF